MTNTIVVNIRVDNGDDTVVYFTSEGYLSSKFDHTLNVSTVETRGHDVLALGTREGDIYVGLAEISNPALHRLRGHEARITDLRFTDKLLVSTSEDGTVRFWGVRP